jgi:hypothetical protein
LKRQQNCAFADQRCQQFAEAVVRRGLQANNNEIAPADFPRRLRSDWADLKIAVGALDMHTVVSNGLVIGAEQEVHISTGLAQFTPIKTANSTAADDGDLVEFALVLSHLCTKKAPSKRGRFSLE